MATLAEVLRQAGYVTPQGQVVGPRTTTAQTMSNYIRNIIPNAAQNLAQQRADIDAALTMGDQGIQIGDRAAFERQMAQVPNLMGLTAYHGTPHTIKGKFDISKVGTGEGAQAYGHGMYFAESPKTAEYYKDLSKNILYTPEGQPFNFAYELSHPNVRATLNKTKDVDSAIQRAKQLIENKSAADVAQKDLQILENLKNKGGLQEGTGNLYKVDIPDEYIPKMVQWETPLSEMDEKLASVIKPLQEQLKNQPNPDLFKNAKSVGDVIQYSNAIGLKPHIPLQEAGYKGIRYLDEGSRSSGKGTSNFVVFDPAEVKILEQNSKPMTRKEILEQELKKVVE